ncbi:UvrD-helicase domain-containing protein [Streptomyces lydicus]
MTAPDPGIDRLTHEQLLAAGSPQSRLYIEAAPGSGKTTVSTQRYGLHRFARTADHRAVLAVSFTRSATAEIRDRVLERWGPAALTWPHRIVTLDTVIHDLLTHLLQAGLVQWPGGHRELQVFDTWRTHLPSVYVFQRPVLKLDGCQVTTGVVRERQRTSTVDQTAFEAAVSEGLCTHEDVRCVLELALGIEKVRTALTTFLGKTVRSLIVDEIFDANLLDLEIVSLAASAALGITLVGDPWQALYSFRGARPEEVPRLIAQEGFTQKDLQASFRWRSNAQRTLAMQLRRREGTVVDRGLVSEVDVVLAREWKSLWDTDPQVLPLAIKSASGQFQEAAVTLLLDAMTDRAFGLNAIFLNDALTTLDITDKHALARLRPRLQKILDLLAGDEDLRIVWGSLNTEIATESDSKAPTKHHPTHIARLEKLRTRLRLPYDQLVPGLTCHQAKGREWDYVGVRLEESDLKALRTGLDPDDEDHRKIYVALTRARLLSVAV